LVDQVVNARIHLVLAKHVHQAKEQPYSSRSCRPFEIQRQQWILKPDALSHVFQLQVRQNVSDRERVACLRALHRDDDPIHGCRSSDDPRFTRPLLMT
jgi:hypothetical protein